MAAQFILHAGFHKTGTTAVQRALRANARALARQGVAAASMEVGGRRIWNLSQPMASLFAADRAGYRRNIERGLAPAAAARDAGAALDALIERPPAGRVVLSAEALASLPEDGLKALRDRIEARGHAVRCVSFVRAPEAYLTAVTAQRVRGGETLARIRVDLRLCEAASRLEAAFPDCGFHSFSEARRAPGGPAAFFFGTIGVDASGFEDGGAANPTGSDQAIRLLSAINAREPRLLGEGADARANPAREPGDANPLLATAGDPFRLTEAEIAPRRDDLEREARALQARFGDGFVEERAPPRPAPAPWSEAALRALRDAVDLSSRRMAFLALDAARDAGLSEADVRAVFFAPGFDENPSDGRAAPRVRAPLAARALARLRGRP